MLGRMRNQTGRRRLAHESLESRRLLAVDVAELSNLLGITHDQAAEIAPALTAKTDDDGVAITPGDFNNDSQIDAADIDMLSLAVRTQSTSPDYDIDFSGDVTRADLDMLVHDILNTEYGDANLDGAVNGDDLVEWDNNKWTVDTGWATGDFNGDSLTDVSDYNLWSENKLFVATPTARSTSTDEPGPLAELNRGDFDRNDVVDANDIDILFAAVNSGATDMTFDLNLDGQIDRSDVDRLVRDILNTNYGDVNLDLIVGQIDVDTWYEYKFQTNTGWLTGDVNGDGVTDVSDLNRIRGNVVPSNLAPVNAGGQFFESTDASSVSQVVVEESEEVASEPDNDSAAEVVVPTAKQKRMAKPKLNRSALYGQSINRQVTTQTGQPAEVIAHAPLSERAVEKVGRRAFGRRIST